jgi:AcrR family transcriptional regulator
MHDRKHSTRREKILTSACHIADHEGLESVTVRAVADKADVAIGTLRHYFPTQKDLFDAIVERRVDAIIDDSVVLDPSATLDARIASMVGQYLPAELDDATSLRLWFTSYSTALGPAPSTAALQLLTAAARRSHEHMRRWFRHFADEGLLEAETVEDAVGIAIALTVGVTLEALTPGSPMTVPHGRTLLTRHFMALLRKEQQ